MEGIEKYPEMIQEAVEEVIGYRCALTEAESKLQLAEAQLERLRNEFRIALANKLSGKHFFAEELSSD